MLVWVYYHSGHKEIHCFDDPWCGCRYADLKRKCAEVQSVVLECIKSRKIDPI